MPIILFALPNRTTVKRFMLFVFVCLAFLCTASSQAGNDTTNAPMAVLTGLYADPHISVSGKKFYIYPTTDGSVGWNAISFSAWSSADLQYWTNEGEIFNVARDLTWAKTKAKAPAVAFKNGKYYLYFSAEGNIGVAESDKPNGPFRDAIGKPLVAKGAYTGQMTDPMVFIDDDGAAYLVFGQGNCHVVKLNDDMISFEAGKVNSFKPVAYNEAPFLFKRSGKYYLLWSENDTRDPRYNVSYAIGDAPLGPFTKVETGPVLRQKGVVKAPGHASVIQIPGKDEWYITYHRFKIPGGNGYNRETCISPLRFDATGNIIPVNVFEKIKAVKIKQALFK
jgi:beta-xylosidase